MLPEQIAHLLGEEDFKRLSHKFDHLLNVDYFYPSDKAEMVQFITELAALTYMKGRDDERYYLAGPSFSIYEKSK